MEVFEDKIDDIDDLLKKSRSKWMLDAIQWMDYDDVSQIIRLHISDKWDQWDQSRPFKPWCHRVISNRMKNLVRDNYSKFQKPCLRCPHYMGEDLCLLTESGKQDYSCDIYAKWESKKKNLHDVRLPLPIEGKTIVQSEEFLKEVNVEESASKLHKEILNKLSNEKHRLIYTMLYIREIDEENVAQRMGFAVEKSNKSSRYKQLDNLKKKFVELAREVLEEKDIL